jgi:hypothetical protein
MGGRARIFGGVILVIDPIILVRLFFCSAILLFQGPIGIIVVIAFIAGGITLFAEARRSRRQPSQMRRRRGVPCLVLVDNIPIRE